MTLTPQWLDELRSRITLSGVISRTTRLTKAGREFKACCPFHNEKSPSFTVNDEKGFYHCFGCGAHGDAIRWMTDQRGLSFMDAVKELAAEASMDVPAPDPQAAQRAEKRDTLFDVTQGAQDWFVDNLQGADGAAAREYLASRGFDALTIERFGFGYAPENRQAMKQGLSRFPHDKLIEAGLRIAVEDRDPYDRFRERLMLPIQDTRGRVIAFGGRILDAANKNAPKYLNSPDTPLFDKGRTLYNMHRAAPATRQSGRIIVVEGYMDVIALAAAGIEECVAPMGTALTEQQIELLWRHAESPILCFDGDAAGQRAAMRAVSRALPLLRPSHSMRIVTMPSGLDPDDVLKQQGTEAMEALLGKARSLIDMLWLHEREAVPLETPEDKAGLKARLLAHVDAIAEQDIRALYRRELLDRFSAFAFPKREPTRGFEKGAFKQRNGNRPAPSSPENIGRLRRSADGGSRDAFSAAILAGLLRWPAEIARHAETIAGTPGLDKRFATLLDCCDAGQSLESGDLSTILAQQGLEVPKPSEYSGLRFAFLSGDATAENASGELAQAIELLVERPALNQALAQATARLENELSDDAYAEQQRLLKRKLEFDRRLVQMATKRAAISQVT
ncbi:MAG: DNA primase [Sphingomonadaceae bacterium]|nr:DNA primase [Sphingomonadaceae bacterium]